MAFSSAVPSNSMGQSRSTLSSQASPFPPPHSHTFKGHMDGIEPIQYVHEFHMHHPWVFMGFSHPFKKPFLLSINVIRRRIQSKTHIHIFYANSREVEY
jgi:hypothetical protein